MATQGYKPTGNPQGYLYFASSSINQIIAYIPDEMVENGWAYRMNFRVGPVTPGSRNMRGVIWDTSPNPDDKLGQTEIEVCTTVMSDQTEGAMQSANMESAVKLQNGRTFALGVHSLAGQSGIGTIDQGHLPGQDNYLIYYATDIADPPLQQFVTNTTTSGRHLAVSVDYEANVPPDKPSGMSPSNFSTQSSLTPMFSADFVDANALLPNGIEADTMQSFRIEVRRVSDNALMWDYDENTTGDERAADHFSRMYDGLPLAINVDYRWRCWQRDQFGAESEVSSWLTFNVTAGSVDVSTGTPTGKIETLQPTFTGIWKHTTTSANAVRVRVREAATGAVKKQLPTPNFVTLSPVVANNGAITVTWAQLVAQGWGTDLSWGGDHIYEMQGRTLAGEWTGWSVPARAFKVNQCPSTPTIVSPVNGEVRTARPTLTVTSTDDDTVATGFVVKVKIKRVSTGITSGPFSMVLRAGTTNTWDLVTTSTHLPAFDTYQWWAYSGDGTVWSGKVLTEASAATSSVAQFDYATGPTVVVSNPINGSIITTDTPTFIWTTPGSTQASFRVLVWNRVTSTEVYDTNFILSATQNFSMPSGYLRQQGKYEVRVYVVSSLSLSGQSDWVTFDLEYNEPVALPGVSASLTYGIGDVEPTVVLLQWGDPVIPAGGVFKWFRITREPSDDEPVAVEDRDRETRQVQVARIASVASRRFEDHRASPGIVYDYYIRVYYQMGSDQIGSAISKATIQLDFEQGILHQIPESGYKPDHRVVFQYREEVRVPVVIQNTYWRPMNKPKPLVFKSRAFSKELSGIFKLSADSPAEVDAMIRDVHYMAAMANPCHWKDGRKRNFYCVVDKVEEMDPPGGRIRRLDLTLKEIDYPEIYL